MKILKKFKLLFLVFFGLIAFYSVTSQSFARLPDEDGTITDQNNTNISNDGCSGSSGNFRNCVIEVNVKDNNGNPINNITVLKWRNTSQGNNVKDARGNNNREEWQTGKRLPNGRVIFYNLPAGTTYKVQVNPGNEWECASGNCQQSNITLNANNKKRVYNFTLRTKGTTQPPGENENANCKNDQRVKPKLSIQGNAQKTGALNGDYFEKNFTFKLVNKNPTTAKCGKRDYKLYAQSPSGNWGPNPPSFEFVTGDQVNDLGPGQSKDQLKIKVKVFETTPEGTYAFTVTGQDMGDSGTTRMSDPIQYRFTVPQGGDDGGDDDGGDDGEDDGDEGDDQGDGTTGKLHVRMGLNGIGTVGDLQSPACRFSTRPPQNRTRDMKVTLRKTSDNTVAYTFDNITATYQNVTNESATCPDPATPADQGKFTADINLPVNFISGSYNVVVESKNSPNLPGEARIQSINIGQTKDITVNLSTGYFLRQKDDDEIAFVNVNDWQILNECMKKTNRPINCSHNGNAYKVDLNDNGRLDGDDLNLFLRDFFFRDQ